jgi:DNA polymerase III subunit delta'
MASRPKKGDLIPDPREGPDHPRLTTTLEGHDAAERIFLDAWGKGRLHHAWMITGPEGIGKATLAWRIARFLLAHPYPEGAIPRDLASDPHGEAGRLIAARSHPDLFVLERPVNPETGKLKQDIAVDDVRRVNAFFARTAAYGGWRVVIVDAVDDLNASSANALLKILEEPPPQAIFLLVAHAPGRSLKTIRSRCRVLALRAPVRDGGGRDAPAEAASALTQVRNAIASKRAMGVDAMGRIAEQVGGFGRERHYDAFSRALVGTLRDHARARALASDPAAVRWASTAVNVAETFTTAGDLNIDKRLTTLAALTSVMDTLRKA